MLREGEVDGADDENLTAQDVLLPSVHVMMLACMAQCTVSTSELVCHYPGGLF